MSTFSRRTLLQLLSAPLLMGRELRCDVAIIGGGVGGCAAALGALRNGMRVIMTEGSDWIGGQLTSEGVPPDEHDWIEAFGGTESYRTFRGNVRSYYDRNYLLTTEMRRQVHFNPGGGTVSDFTLEPRAALAVLTEMLAPWLTGGELIILTHHTPVSADVDRDRVRAVAVQSADTGMQRIIQASYFIDATETGALLPLTKTEYTTGFESRKQTGEPHAPENAQPTNIQAFTVCFAMDYLKDEDHTIERPEEYSFWRDYVPDLHPAWPGKLISWTTISPQTLKARGGAFNPEREDAPLRGTGLDYWFYRRIVAKKHFAPGSVISDVSLVNWPQNDYMLGNLYEVPEEEAAKHLKGAKQLSLSLLYWLQTEAPRQDGKQGWPGLRLRADQMGTEDGLAKLPYIRESRRIQAEFTVLEQHVSTDARRREGKSFAEPFADSIGVGSYRLDLHPTSGGDNYIDISSLPFQIPMGALIPKRVENLLAASKNIGTTHITNGCYRLHPVEWNIGESAGALAAFAVNSGNTPRAVRNNQKLLKSFQARIKKEGIEIEWPRLTPR
jgi:hypothetical protein